MSNKRGAEGEEDLVKLAVKHASLKQDYNELQRETRALKKRMQRATLKKNNLLAEVRFLRRRHRFLTKNSSEALPQKQSLAVSRSMGTRKRAEYDYEVHAKQPPPSQQMAAKYEYSVVHAKQPLPFQQMAAKYEYSNRGTSFEETVAPQPLRNKQFNMVDSFHSYENKPPAPREFQVFWEPLREAAPTYAETPIRMPILENGGLANDLKLSILKDIPNGFVLHNKTGRRNSSWQDQMVLRV